MAAPQLGQGRAAPGPRAQAAISQHLAGRAGVPIPKFARVCRTPLSELRKRRTPANSMILVPLRARSSQSGSRQSCANFGLAALGRPAPPFWRLACSAAQERGDLELI